MNINVDPNNPLSLIPFALATNPDAVAVLPIFHPAAPNATMVLRSRTILRRLPQELAEQMAQQAATEQGNGGKVELPSHLEIGRVLLTIPADVAQNLKGPAQDRHPLFMFAVRRELYDDLMRRAESGLVLPSMMPSGGSGIIIKP